MKNKNTDFLRNKKIKLAFVFTLIVFIFLLTLEISFIGFKFFGEKTSEERRLSSHIENISRVFLSSKVEDQVFLNDFLKNNNIRNIVRPKFVRNKDFIPYTLLINKADGQILFSSSEDNNIQSYIASMITGGKEKEIFKYDSVYYISQTKDISINGISYKFVAFSDLKFSPSDAFGEFFTYLIFSVIVSIILYLLGYNFVSYNLRPVEESMRDMENFVYNAGHELKTPISVVLSNLQLSLLTKNYDNAINESIAELKKMNGLIESLLELAVIDKNTQTESIVLNTFLAEIVEGCKEKALEKNISVELIEKAAIMVNSNRDYLKIAISNILSNAVKYTPEGGTVKVTIEGNSVEISDTGIGIAEENISKIFDRFYQETDSRNQDGFGIGLSLVKKISDMYGWKIKVTSEKDKGTSFRIIF